MLHSRALLPLIVVFLPAYAMAGSPDRVVNVTEFGAKCDGRTDDTTSIQTAVNTAAANGERVWVPGICLANDLTLPSGTYLEGPSGAGGTAGGVLAGAAPGGSGDLLLLGDRGSEANNIVLDHLTLEHCRRCIWARSAVSETLFNDVYILPHDAGIYIDGSWERGQFVDVVIQGGNYGIYRSNANGFNGENQVWDKNSFFRLRLDGQHINAIAFNGTASATNDVFYGVQMVNIGQDGIYFGPGNGANHWIFDGWNIENGANFYGPHVGAVTTGSVTAGSTKLTVANGAACTRGAAITIQTAGDLRTTIGDLNTTIASCDANIIALATPAVSTASNIEVVFSGYDDFHNVPTGMTWRNVEAGDGAGTAGVSRYFISGAGYGATIINSGSSRPIAFAGAATGAVIIGGYSPIRNSNAAQSYCQTVLEQEKVSNSRNVSMSLCAHLGGNAIISLNGSNDNGTGTFGDFGVVALNDSVMPDKWLLRVKGDGSEFSTAARTYLLGGTGGVSIAAGTGAPTGLWGHGESGNCINASQYLRQDGSTGSRRYVCQSGNWTAAGD